MKFFPRRGLLAVSDEDIPSDREFESRCMAVVEGGANALQFRDKTRDGRRRLERAQFLNSLCQKQNIPLIINDDVELALQISAAGVHLGRDDMPLVQARTQLGPRAIIGISCYNDLGRAREAAAHGADYVAFGRFFASRTKPDAVLAPSELLSEARLHLRIPIVAIGGITPENGLYVIEAGADVLAVVKGVFGAADPKRAAQAMVNLFK